MTGTQEIKKTSRGAASCRPSQHTLEREQQLHRRSCKQQASKPTPIRRNQKDESIHHNKKDKAIQNDHERRI
jgi:hypothetical protein